MPIPKHRITSNHRFLKVRKISENFCFSDICPRRKEKVNSFLNFDQILEYEVCNEIAHLE